MFVVCQLLVLLQFACAPARPRGPDEEKKTYGNFIFACVSLLEFCREPQAGRIRSDSALQTCA